MCVSNKSSGQNVWSIDWLILNPWFIVFLFFLFTGNDFMKEEKFSDALKCYSDALRLDNKNSVYYCNR